jgi:hypothetical protein
VWHVDFEYSTYDDGSPREPFLMAAHHHASGRTILLWGDDLINRPEPPFPVDERTVVVSHYCPAEDHCFRRLGWPRPRYFDTSIEYRLTGAYADAREGAALRKRAGRHEYPGPPLPGLKGAIKLNAMARALDVRPYYSDSEKEALQGRAARGSPFAADERRRLMDYCLSDTLLTRSCLPSLIGDERGWAAAAVRADFLLLCVRMQERGVPVQVRALSRLIDRRLALRSRVIRDWDRYDLYRDESFCNRRFVDFLVSTGRPWPYLEGTGRPDLRRETFRDQAKIDPVFGEIGRVRDTVSLFKSMKLQIDPDGRTRTELRPFHSKTGRSQPSGSACLFLMPKFLRKFVAAPPESCLVMADYAQQEVLVAAVLSGDGALLDAYRDGDCYIGLGKQLGLIPANGSKSTHPIERNRCKPLLLGLLYRMSAEGLTSRLKLSTHEGRALYRRLRQTFSTYFAWAEDVIGTTMIGHPLTTPLGWTLRPRPTADNVRSRVNFLVQATASDILRAACLMADARGLVPLMTVHDSILIEAPVDAVEDAACTLEAVMREAAVAVLGEAGAPMRTTLDRIYPGHSLPVDPADESRFGDVQRWLEELDRAA